MCRFYYVKLQALTAIQDWPSLETFAKSRRSPIGYEVRTPTYSVSPASASLHSSVSLFADCPLSNVIRLQPFVTHLCAQGYPKEGARYVPRCETKHRIDLWIKCGDFSSAAAECKERGDKQRLEQLVRSAPTTLVKRELEALLSSMNR